MVLSTHALISTCALLPATVKLIPFGGHLLFIFSVDYLKTPNFYPRQNMNMQSSRKCLQKMPIITCAGFEAIQISQIWFQSCSNIGLKPQYASQM